MKVLVTFAVDSEFAPWRRRHGFVRIGSAPASFAATIGGIHARVVLTGMGQERALAAARASFALRPDICISAGLAGALRPGFQPGDVLAARLVSEAGQPLAVASHGDLLSEARACGAQVVERFATSNTIVARAEEKRALGAEADAVEMESYAILVEAARHGVPAVAIRAVSDTVDFDLPYDFSSAGDEEGRIRASRVIWQVLRRPAGVPSLLRFALDCRLGARKLAAFLDVYAGSLNSRLIPVESELAAAT